MELGDARAAAFEAGCRGQEVGKPVKVHLVPGRKGVVVGIGASKSVREPGIHLGMPFLHGPGRRDVPGQADDGAQADIEAVACTRLPRCRERTCGQGRHLENVRCLRGGARTEAGSKRGFRSGGIGVQVPALLASRDKKPERLQCARRK